MSKGKKELMQRLRVAIDVDRYAQLEDLADAVAFELGLDDLSMFTPGQRRVIRKAIALSEGGR